jgi:anti-sigma factor RsiW
MCEYSGRLVAWVDREVEAADAAEIERHIKVCTACRACVAEFERVSGAFEEYCEAVVRSEENHKTIRVDPVLWAAATAIVLAVMLIYPKRGVAPPEVQQSVATAPKIDSLPLMTAKAIDNASVPPPLRADRRVSHQKVAVHGFRGAACCAPIKTQTQSANWVADDPAIQIAIPAEAMFPPGAMPEGVNFVADVSIGADGMAEQLRLRPQPVRFERRASQP